MSHWPLVSQTRLRVEIGNHFKMSCGREYVDFRGAQEWSEKPQSPGVGERLGRAPGRCIPPGGGAGPQRLAELPEKVPPRGNASVGSGWQGGVAQNMHVAGSHHEKEKAPGIKKGKAKGEWALEHVPARVPNLRKRARSGNSTSTLFGICKNACSP